MSARDPFQLIDPPSAISFVQVADTVPLVVMPLELEVVMDETIQMLCEKLAEAEDKVEMAKKDSLRLLWLEERLGRLDRRISDDIFGDWDWTSIRRAIDAATERGL